RRNGRVSDSIRPPHMGAARSNPGVADPDTASSTPVADWGFDDIAATPPSGLVPPPACGSLDSPSASDHLPARFVAAHPQSDIPDLGSPKRSSWETGARLPRTSPATADRVIAAVCPRPESQRVRLEPSEVPVTGELRP